MSTFYSDAYPITSRLDEFVEETGDRIKLLEQQLEDANARIELLELELDDVRNQLDATT